VSTLPLPFSNSSVFILPLPALQLICAKDGPIFWIVKLACIHFSHAPDLPCSCTQGRPAFPVSLSSLPLQSSFSVCLSSLPLQSSFSVCLSSLPFQSAFPVCRSSQTQGHLKLCCKQPDYIWTGVHVFLQNPCPGLQGRLQSLWFAAWKLKQTLSFSVKMCVLLRLLVFTALRVHFSCSCVGIPERSVGQLVCMPCNLDGHWS